MSKNTDFVQISILPETREAFNHLRKEKKVSLYEYLKATAKFLKDNGIDPFEVDIKTPSLEIKKFHKTYVSFTKTQEKEYLMPIKAQLDEIVMFFAREGISLDSSSTKKVQSKTDIGLGMYLPGANFSGSKNANAIPAIIEPARDQASMDDIQKLKIEKEKLEDQIDDYNSLLLRLKNKFSRKRDHYVCELNELEFLDCFGNVREDK